MITIYSKPNCPNCEIAKAQAMLHGIKYTEIVLTPEDMPGFKSQYPSARSAPFVVHDQEVIGGLTSFKNWLRGRK